MNEVPVILSQYFVLILWRGKCIDHTDSMRLDRHCKKCQMALLKVLRRKTTKCGLQIDEAFGEPERQIREATSRSKRHRKLVAKPHAMAKRREFSGQTRLSPFSRLTLVVVQHCFQIGSEE